MSIIKQQITIWQIIAVVISAIGLGIAAFNISNEQIASIVALSKTELGDASALLARLGAVFRLALLLIVFLGAYIIVRALAKRHIQDEKRVLPIGRIVSQSDALQEAIAYLTAHRSETTSLRIWGYSLNWINTLSSFFSEHRCPCLNVKLFVPVESIIGTKFVDAKTDERKGVLRLRVREWQELETRSMVAGVRVYSHARIPNDLGFMLDDGLTFLHTYDWRVTNAHLLHVRQGPERRIFIRLSPEVTEDQCLIEHYRFRFLCREFDAE